MWTPRNTTAMAANSRWKSTNQGMVGLRPNSRDDVASPTNNDNEALSHETNAADRVTYQKN